jgi:hypothetical protein
MKVCLGARRFTRRHSAGAACAWPRHMKEGGIWNPTGTRGSEDGKRRPTEEERSVRDLMAVGIKFVAVWAIMLLFGLSWGPGPAKSAVIALIVAGGSWLADKKIPFAFQGWNRWAVDAGLATLAVYVGQFVWPGQAIALHAAVFVGAVIGAVEIPLHYLLKRWLPKERERVK